MKIMNYIADKFDVFSMKWMRHIKYQENENFLSA